MKEKIKQYFARKSKFGLALDILVVFLFIATLIPQTRMELMTFLIKGRMLVVQPSVLESDESVTLDKSDYQLLFKDLSGNNFDFSQLKGKVVFLNFWATWCPPCVAEFSEIQELYNRYKDHPNVAFLLVSNEDPAVIRKFIKKNNYSIPIYLQYDRLPQALSSASIPTTFVISKAGKIIIREVGAVNWAGESMINTMETLLKE